MFAIPKLTKPLPQRIILLGWVSFFADISSEMIYPLMPLFLVSILGSPALAMGLIEGIAQVVVSIMSVFSGTLTDRTGRRVPFIRWGYGLPIIGKTLMSIAGSWHFVLLGRSIDRFGKGLRGSPRDALIADAINSERRGEAFGFHRMMDTSGAFLGVILAAGALWFLRGGNQEAAYRLIFGLAALLAVCSCLVTLFVDETQRSPSGVQRENKVPSPRQPLTVTLPALGRKYWTTLSILTVFAFANSSDAFLLLRAADVGLSPLQVVLVYALYNLSYALFSSTAGKLSDTHGRWHVIVIGWAIYAVVYAGIAMTDNYFIWALFVFYGIYMALTEGVSKALIVDCAPPDSKGTALGILYMALGFSALTSNILAGYLWDSYEKSLPFWLGSITAVVAISIVVFSGRLSGNRLP